MTSWAFPATFSNHTVDCELSPTLGAHNNGTNNPACFVDTHTPNMPHLSWPTIPQLKHRTVRYGSLCSGIEAATVAWHLLPGWEPAWFSQFDPEHTYKNGPDFPSAVLAHHYPTVPNLGDMTSPEWMDRAADCGEIDVLVGGTPCQAFSIAGLRAGLDDARGQLSLRFCEIANAANPLITLWENVPGVLSDKTNGFGCLLAGLAGEDDALVAPGGKWSDAGVVFGPSRTVAWRILDAQYCGVAQRRRRVFVVACPADSGLDPCAILLEFNGVRRDSPPSRLTGQGTAAGAAGVADVAGFDRYNQCLTGEVSCTVRLPLGGDNLPHALVNGPGVMVAGCDLSQKAEGIGFTAEQAPYLCSGTHPGHGSHVLAAYGFEPRIARNGRGDCGDLMSALKADAGKTGKGDAAPCVAYITQEGVRNSQKAHEFPVKDGAGPTNTVDTTGGGGVCCIPIMEAQGRTSGGGKDLARAGLGIGSDGDPMYTIQARPPHGVALYGEDLSHLDGVAVHENQRSECREMDQSQGLTKGGGKPGQGYPAARQAGCVRRLTPVECERLQGFPDDYTLIPWKKAAAPDGPRYKALGNSMAVPVMRWIGLRLHLALTDPAQLEP
jgi:DNA (cytosine-5)-methyltransferase 1